MVPQAQPTKGGNNENVKAEFIRNQPAKLDKFC